MVFQVYNLTEQLFPWCYPFAWMQMRANERMTKVIRLTIHAKDKAWQWFNALHLA